MTDDTDDRIRRLYADDCNHVEIAIRLGLDRADVLARLKALGLIEGAIDGRPGGR